jgi:N-acetyltransferase
MTVAKSDQAPPLTFAGDIVRLEPLLPEHVEPLNEASRGFREAYRWSFVPEGIEETRRYVETALSWQSDGLAVPFVIARIASGKIIGSTRFFNIERWNWPPGHERYGNKDPDAVEIGYSWLAADSLRSGANVEAKMLLLTYAFEMWRVLRVCFHTDFRNERSRRALSALGATFEGFLRSHRMAADFTPRTSARFSIIQSEWHEIKTRLLARLARHPKAATDVKG